MDKERILAKIDELESYQSELEKIMPTDYSIYSSSVEKRRACERLLQISIESVLDICHILVTGLKLGVPSDEDDVFYKMKKEKIIDPELHELLQGMKGFRNILVHKYGTVDDELVFEMLTERLSDFERFKKSILDYLKNV
jgi:uncharacterized protein YutE (UPF0331/DUF86 family)